MKTILLQQHHDTDAPSLAACGAWSVSCAPCEEFSTVSTLVRDGRIGRSEARGEDPVAGARLWRRIISRADKGYTARGEWAFPLAGVLAGYVRQQPGGATILPPVTITSPATATAVIRHSIC